MNAYRDATLVAYLKIHLKKTEIKGDKAVDYFRIEDREYKGNPAYRVRGKDDSRPFVRGEPGHLLSAHIKFDIAKEKLWFGSTGPVRAYAPSKEPIALGTYDLEIPGFPHDIGPPIRQTWHHLVPCRLLG